MCVFTAASSYRKLLRRESPDLPDEEGPDSMASTV